MRGNLLQLHLRKWKHLSIILRLLSASFRVQEDTQVECGSCGSPIYLKPIISDRANGDQEEPCLLDHLVDAKFLTDARATVCCPGFRKMHCVVNKEQDQGSTGKGLYSKLFFAFSATVPECSGLDQK